MDIYLSTSRSTTIAMWTYSSTTITYHHRHLDTSLPADLPPSSSRCTSPCPINHNFLPPLSPGPSTTVACHHNLPPWVTYGFLTPPPSHTHSYTPLPIHFPSHPHPSISTLSHLHPLFYPLPPHLLSHPHQLSHTHTHLSYTHSNTYTLFSIYTPSLLSLP